MTEKELLELKIGETLGETCREVLRVPGGWIFYNWDFVADTVMAVGTFVPHPASFPVCDTCGYKETCASAGTQCCDYKKENL